MRRSLILLVVLVITPACGGSHSGEQTLPGFLGREERAAMFLQWTKDGNQVRGSVNVAQLDGSEVEREDASFTGSINGESVSLSFPLGLGTWNGRLADDRLTLTAANEDGALDAFALRPADFGDYRAAVRRLEDRAGEEAIRQAAEAKAEAERSARAEAEAALGRALLDLEDSAEALASDVDDMRAELEQVERELSEVEDEAAVEPMDEYQAEVVGFAAEDVGFAREAVGFAHEAVLQAWRRAQDDAAKVERLARQLGESGALSRRSALVTEGQGLVNEAGGLPGRADELVVQAEQIAADARARVVPETDY